MPETRYKREWRSDARARRAFEHYLSAILDCLTVIPTPGVGERIKQVREHRGLTQRELGEKLGISQATMCRLEAGAVPYIPVSASRFKDAFADDFTWILKGGPRIWRNQEKPIENVWVARNTKRDAESE